jgi:hypothetical protein
MRKRALHVALHASEPSVVEVTVGERVQLDRVTPSQYGGIAERHGTLLEPGVNTIALAQGHYFFKTLSDAHLHVVRGGIDARPIAFDKDPWPDPPPKAVPDAKGDDTAGELPQLTIA